MIARTNRFHGLHSLTHAYRKGQTQRGPQLTLKYALNHRRQSYRVAVVVSKKVAKSAVVRNRIRRRIYEAVRCDADAITKPYDLIVTVFGAQFATMDADGLRRIVRSQLQKAGVIGGANGSSRVL